MRTRSLCLIFVLGVILFAVVDGRGGRGGGSRGGSRGSSSRGSSSRGSSSRGSTSSSSSQSSRGTYEHRGSKGQSESKPKPPEPTNVKPSAPDFKESSRPSPGSPSQPAHNPNYPVGSGGQPGGQPAHNPNYPSGSGGQPGGQPAHNPNYPSGSGSQPANNPNYPRPGAQPGVNQQPPPYPGAGSGQNLGNPPPYPGHGSGQNLGNPPPYPGHGSGQNLGNPPAYPGVNQPRPPPYDTQPLPPGPGFKPGVGNPPYPVQPGTGGQPYPRQPGGAPYPQQPGGVPYPQRPGGGAPYPQQPGIGNPSHQGRVPYPQQPGGVYGNPPSYTQHSGFPLGGNPYTKPYKKKGLLGQVFSFGKKPKVHKPKSFGGGYGASSGMPKAMYPMMPMSIKAKKPKFGSPFRSPSFIFIPMFMPGFYHHHHHSQYYYDIENAEYRGRCRKPFKPDNSTMDCDTTSRGASCTVKCIENYHFSDNETSKTHQCWHVGGVWRPTRNFPKCEPTCKEECHNGGKCVRPEVCACDPEYRGEKCEHHVLNCDVRKFAGGNGNSNKISWVCQHTRNETKCRVKCRAGGHFAEEPQSREYHCKINGEWTPDSIPNCIIEVKNATLLEMNNSTLPEMNNSTLPEMNNSTVPEMNNSTLLEEKNSTVSEEKNSTIPEEEISTIPSLPAE